MGREEKLMKGLREETSRSIKNSRGQSLGLTWATTTAVGRWPSLLPKEAVLPWIMVFKMSRAGLRVAVLQVPTEGAKTKRRISDGVPKLLQEIASGSARFEAMTGS